MELERRLKKVARYHLALFLLPVLSLLYYGWWKATDLDQRPDNPLRTAPVSRRGPILDRHERPLAHSQGQLRLYPLGEKTGPLIGYHLRGRNQSGLEAALQGTLSPPPPPKSLWGALARDRQTSGEISGLQGPSVVLTLDSALQSQLYELFGERAGALAVATAEGEILAAVSAPSFDPNRVAQDWQELRGDPRSPFIERVAGGLYPVLKASGEALLDPDRLETHPWFADYPFPDYPGASSALIVEGRVLVTPLMLLQLAAGPESRFEPRLLKTAKQTAAASTGPRTELPRLQEALSIEDFAVYRLLGPAFRESPPFDVVVGRSGSGTDGLVFALVMEEHSEDGLGLVRRALGLLRDYPRP